MPLLNLNAALLNGTNSGYIINCPGCNIFGFAAGNLGDIDNNGYADFAVGDYIAHKVYVFLVGPSGVLNTNPTSFTGSNGGFIISCSSSLCPGSTSYFGIWVSSIGDWNKDGFADIGIGDSYKSIVYIAWGGAGFVNFDVATSYGLNGGVSIKRSTGKYFGYPIVNIGSINCDGPASIAVGDQLANTVSVIRYVNNISASLDVGSSTGSIWFTISSASNGFFGSTIAALGDIDGDFCSDIAIGDIKFNSVYLARGKRNITSMDASALSNSINGAKFSNSLGQQFGINLAAIRNFNGGNCTALAMGDHLGQKVYVAFLNCSFVSKDVANFNGANGGVIFTSSSGMNFGFRVMALNDINGDGYSDLGIGDFGANTADIFYGKAGAFSNTNAATFTGLNGGVHINSSPGSNFGYFLVGLGDLNHDGYDDFLSTDHGNNRAMVIYGGGSVLPSPQPMPRPQPSIGSAPRLTPSPYPQFIPAPIPIPMIYTKTRVPTKTATKVVTPTLKLSGTYVPTKSNSKAFTSSRVRTMSKVQTATATRLATRTLRLSETHAPTRSNSKVVTSTRNLSNTLKPTRTKSQITASKDYTMTRAPTATITRGPTRTLQKSNTSALTKSVSKVVTSSKANTATRVFTSTTTLKSTHTLQLSKTRIPTKSTSMVVTSTPHLSSSPKPTGTKSQVTFSPAHTITHANTRTITGVPTHTLRVSGTHLTTRSTSIVNTPTQQLSSTANPTYTKSRVTDSRVYTITHAPTKSPSRAITGTRHLSGTFIPTNTNTRKSTGTLQVSNTQAHTSSVSRGITSTNHLSGTVKYTGTKSQVTVSNAHTMTRASTTTATRAPTRTLKLTRTNVPTKSASIVTTSTKRLSSTFKTTGTKSQVSLSQAHTRSHVPTVTTTRVLTRTLRINYTNSSTKSDSKVGTSTSHLSSTFKPTYTNSRFTASKAHTVTRTSTTTTTKALTRTLHASETSILTKSNSKAGTFTRHLSNTFKSTYTKSRVTVSKAHTMTHAPTKSTSRKATSTFFLSKSFKPTGTKSQITISRDCTKTHVPTATATKMLTRTFLSDTRAPTRSPSKAITFTRHLSNTVVETYTATASITKTGTDTHSLYKTHEPTTTESEFTYSQERITTPIIVTATISQTTHTKSSTLSADFVARETTRTLNSGEAQRPTATPLHIAVPPQRKTRTKDKSITPTASHETHTPTHTITTKPAQTHQNAAVSDAPTSSSLWYIPVAIVLALSTSLCSAICGCLILWRRRRKEKEDQQPVQPEDGDDVEKQAGDKADGDSPQETKGDSILPLGGGGGCEVIVRAPEVVANPLLPISEVPTVETPVNGSAAQVIMNPLMPGSGVLVNDVAHALNPLGDEHAGPEGWWGADPAAADTPSHPNAATLVEAPEIPAVAQDGGGDGEPAPVVDETLVAVPAFGALDHGVTSGNTVSPAVPLAGSPADPGDPALGEASEALAVPVNTTMPEGVAEAASVPLPATPDPIIPAVQDREGVEDLAVSDQVFGEIAEDPAVPDVTSTLGAVAESAMPPAAALEDSPSRPEVAAQVEAAEDTGAPDDFQAIPSAVVGGSALTTPVEPQDGEDSDGLVTIQASASVASGNAMSPPPAPVEFMSEHEPVLQGGVASDPAVEYTPVMPQEEDLVHEGEGVVAPAIMTGAAVTKKKKRRKKKKKQNLEGDGQGQVPQPSDQGVEAATHIREDAPDMSFHLPPIPQSPPQSPSGRRGGAARAVLPEIAPSSPRSMHRASVASHREDAWPSLSPRHRPDLDREPERDHEEDSDAAFFGERAECFVLNSSFIQSAKTDVKALCSELSAIGGILVDACSTVLHGAYHVHLDPDATSCYSQHNMFISVRVTNADKYINTKTLFAHELVHVWFSEHAQLSSYQTVLSVAYHDTIQLLRQKSAQLLAIEPESLDSGSSLLELFYLKSNAEHLHTQPVYDEHAISELGNILGIEASTNQSTVVRVEEMLAHMPRIIAELNLTDEHVYFLKRMADFTHGTYQNWEDGIEELYARFKEMQVAGVSNSTLSLYAPLQAYLDPLLDVTN